MTEPLFWLGLSLLLVAVSLTAVLVTAIPALQELARAARSAEKLFDTLRRELPPTLESIRLTGLEISDLTDDISGGVQNAGSVAKQVNQSLSGAKQQVQGATINTRSVFMGMRAAWQTWQKPNRRRSMRGAPRTGDRHTGAGTFEPTPYAGRSTAENIYRDRPVADSDLPTDPNVLEPEQPEI